MASSEFTIHIFFFYSVMAGVKGELATTSLANMGRLHDDVDEDAHPVRLEILGHRRADGQHDDVGVRLVFEDDFLGLLRAQPDHLRP